MGDLLCELEAAPLKPPPSEDLVVCIGRWKILSSEPSVPRAASLAGRGGRSRDAKEARSDLPPSFVPAPPSLHECVWLADKAEILKAIESKADVNSSDQRAMTPLMLSVELMPRAREEYLAVTRLLLDAAADPRLRTTLGWSPIDEAVALADHELIRLLLDGAQRSLQFRWQRRLESAATSLRMLPDFECRIRWEFDSPVVPLVSMFAPGDVLRIRKQGCSVRLDSTLASWKRFRINKRRELTTLFQGPRSQSGRQLPARLVMLNRSKGTVVDVTEGLDSEESAALVKDLLSSDGSRWDMDVGDVECSEAASWFGNGGACELHGWQAVRFDVKGSLGVTMRKKGNMTQRLSFEHYFGKPLPPASSLPEFRHEFAAGAVSAQVAGLLGEPDDGADSDTQSVASEVLTHWPELQPVSQQSGRDVRDFRVAEKSCSGEVWGRSARNAKGNPKEASGTLPAPMKRHACDKSGKSSHRISASVWLATDFAVPMQPFLAVLHALAAEHELVRRLKELLDSPSVASAAQKAAAEVAGGGGEPKNVFPIRVSVPINLAVRAQLHIEAFEVLKPGSLPDDLFEIPDNFSWLSRRVAQKTPNRTKKRIFLANLVL